MSTKHANVLLIEDNRDDADLIREFMREAASREFKLEIAGYTVLSAVNGFDGLRIMQQRTPDLILSDIMMPEMDGYEFYEAVRANPDWALIPFIFLSAKGERKDIQKGYQLGADHYITKPFEPDELLTVVRARLKRMQEIQSAAQAGVEHMKQQILSHFSHELRTPLTTIYGFVSVLEEDYASFSDGEIEEILDTTRHSAERLIRLVEDLLLLARIDSGAVALEIERFRTRVELSPLVYEVVRDLSVEAEKRRLQVEVQIPATLTVFCVPAYLQDILSRLVDNAIKFSALIGGRIVIRAEEQEGAVVISVQDEGVGLDAAKQKLLFERFRQIDREKLEQQGVGLGLAIASDLLRLHGGNIQVESQPGVGSVFTVSLPQHKREA